MPYFDLGSPRDLKAVTINKGGDELAFQFTQREDEVTYKYSVVVNRVQGKMFSGHATSEPGGDVARISCRVYEDPANDLLLLIGVKWEYPDDPKNHRWMVELETDG